MSQYKKLFSQLDGSYADSKDGNYGNFMPSGERFISSTGISNGGKDRWSVELNVWMWNRWKAQTFVPS